MLQSFLLSMTEITLTMSVLILLLLLFNRLFGSRYTARCRYILWIVVILRLCIPMGTPFMPALLEIPLPEPAEQTELPTAAETDFTSVPESNDSIENNNTVFQITENQTVLTDNQTQNLPGPAETDNTAETERPENRTLSLILVILWASVALILFFTRFIGYLIVSGRLRKTLLLPTERQADLCKRLGIRQGLREKNIPPLYITQEVHSPMLCGFHRPIILLPDIPLTDNQLTGVLAHELTHRRRNDLWVKLACMTATSLHWFNPLVYIAAGRCNREMELSCDELVLAGMDDAVRMAYGKVMLDIIKRCNNPASSLTTHFNPRRSAVRERFEGILDGTRKKRGLWLIVLILTLSLAAGSLVAFGKAEPETDETIPEAVTVEPERRQTETAEAENNDTYPVQIIAMEESITRGQAVEWFRPFSYGTLDMNLLEENTLPFPTNSSDDIQTLYMYNQISFISKYTKVFAVTGALLAGGDPQCAYVFSIGENGVWNVTALSTPGGENCKGVILLGIPYEDSTGWLLAMLHDDGSLRFFDSADGGTWDCGGAYLHPDSGSAWLVQFSKHSGIGGETLCLVFDSPNWEREQIWLSFDWGRSFTRYEIPILENLPGDYEDVIYLYKSSGGGSTEFNLYFQVNGSRNSRYVCYQSAYGETSGTISFYDWNIAENTLQQYRYKSAGDWGNVTFQ